MKTQVERRSFGEGDRMRREEALTLGPLMAIRRMARKGDCGLAREAGRKLANTVTIVRSLAGHTENIQQALE